MCIFQGILCDKALSREQHLSMVALQDVEIRTQAEIISEKDSMIYNLKRDFELQRERYDAEVSELKDKIDELDWRKTKSIYVGAERAADEDQP
jgi:hypothetical protein